VKTGQGGGGFNIGGNVVLLLLLFDKPELLEIYIIYIHTVSHKPTAAHKAHLISPSAQHSHPTPTLKNQAPKRDQAPQTP